MKRILLFGAGRSSTCLIEYLLETAAREDWEIIVADSNLQSAQSKISNSPKAKAVLVHASQDEDRRNLIRQADVVISLLPPALHYLVAVDCIEFGKNLLNASYVDEKTRNLAPDIEAKGLFFLCEMGLDPGIDHMSAMQLIHQCEREGMRITSFRSHTGGLVAPESDNNPWHYKISWNPRNIVLAGSAGAIYKEDGVIKTTNYAEIFADCPEVGLDGLGSFAYYPNRDSLGYIPLYGLETADTFIRTTLRHPGFCKGWKLMVTAGLTDDKIHIKTEGLTFRQWSHPLLPFINPENRSLFEFLGVFDDCPVPGHAKTSADILQYVLETRLPMKPEDKDMIVMLHELDCVGMGRPKQIRSSLVVIGEDHQRTAMAKTVGLPLGISTKLLLTGRWKLKGLHIPILPEIYEPVLGELISHGIRFKEKVI